MEGFGQCCPIPDLSLETIFFGFKSASWVLCLVPHCMFGFDTGKSTHAKVMEENAVDLDFTKPGKPVDRTTQGYFHTTPECVTYHCTI